MSRRQFLYARLPGIRASTYDLLIRGRRVVNPRFGSTRCSTWHSQGRIAARGGVRENDGGGSTNEASNVTRSTGF